MSKITELFFIDENAGAPKYKQIIDSILKAIENKHFSKGDKIPSINVICKEFGLSRDTVMMAFNHLKARGILSSIPGKGYYIDSVEISVSKRVFVLFDELNPFKEDLYNSFLEQLPEDTTVDIFFHHFNLEVLKNLIREAAGKYTNYVIMPGIFDNLESELSVLPKEKVYILDRYKESLSDYSMIYQDFENDVYDALTSEQERFQRYQKLIMVFPGGKEPEGRLIGFRRYCDQYNIDHEIIRSLHNRKLKKGEAYLLPSERNLVKLVKLARQQELKLGQELGIVSFNDTLLKEVVANGITTISTNFITMGQKLATAVIEGKSVKIKNESNITLRASL